MSDLLLYGAGSEVDLTATGVHVEFAFGGSWLLHPDDMAWWDESARVRVQGLSTDRGRATEREQFKQGTARLQVLNLIPDSKTPDRTFDPEWVDGPYYGLLKPGVPVRITKTVAGTNHVLYYGFVDDWPQSYTLGNRLGWSDLSCTDLFGILARTRLPASVLEYVWLKDNPTALWMLDEAAGSVMVDRSGNGHDGELLNVTQGQPPVAAGLARSTFIAHTASARGRVNATLVSGYPFTIEVVIRLDRDLSQFHEIVWVGKDSTANTFFDICVPDTGTGGLGNISIGLTVNGVLVSYANGAVKVDDGRPHVISVRCTSSTSWTLYVDGVNDPLSGSITAAWPSGMSYWSVGNIYANNKGDFGLAGDLNAVAIFPSALLSTTQIDHAEAALTAWEGDRTSKRVERITRDVLGVPVTELTTGFTRLGPATLDAGYALDYLQRVEASEQGRLFIGNEGQVKFLARYHDQTTAITSLFTFTDAHYVNPATGLPYSDLTINQPRAFIFNKATVTADNAAPITVTDKASSNEYGESETSVDAPLLLTPSQQRSLAEFIVQQYKDPHTRITGLRVPLHRDAALAAAVMGLELGHRVTVQRTPQNVGDPILLDCIVEGVAHEIGEPEHWATLYLSPCDTVTYAKWGEAVWGSSKWGY